MLSMKANERRHIEIRKRVAIYNQEIRIALRKRRPKFHRAGRSKGLGFACVLNANFPLAAIPERSLDLFRKVTRAHDHAANSLRSQLHNQELKERNASNASQGLGLRRNHCPQSSAFSSHKQDGWNISYR